MTAENGEAKRHGSDIETHKTVTIIYIYGSDSQYRYYESMCVSAEGIHSCLWYSSIHSLYLC
jgi:hypothetical protein